MNEFAAAKNNFEAVTPNPLNILRVKLHFSGIRP